MRLDRLITLNAARPMQATWRALRFPTSDLQSPGSRRLPILMYHSISDDPEAGIHDYYKVCTLPRRFAEHMQWLADWGFRGVGITEGLAWLRSDGSSDRPTVRQSDGVSKSPAQNCDLRSPSPRHPVAITFDDGYLDNFTEAFPVLRRHGFSATIYLPTAFIGDSTQRRVFKNRPCLTWDEVRTMHHAGVEFGSHTVNHPVLSSLDDATLAFELEASKHAIEEALSAQVHAFAYPYAFPEANPAFVARLTGVLGKAGIQSCATTMVGRMRPSTSDLLIPRLPSNSSDDATLLSAKLQGAYDWIGTLQHFGKRARSFAS